MDVIKREEPPSAVEGFNKRYLLQSASMRVALMNVQRGSDIVRHSHSHSSELFYIVSGSCRLDAGAESVQLNAGDMAIVAPGEAHYFQIGEQQDLVLLAVVAPNLDDAVLHPSAGPQSP